MPLTSLFLAPADPRRAVDRRLALDVLEALAIVDGALGGGAYLAGEGFARHIVFAGCAPHLPLQPPADGGLAFCHVALHGPFAAPRLQTGTNTVKPRCPACRGRFDDWRSALPDWLEHGAPAVCRSCGQRFAAVDLDWRSHAIAGRTLIEVRHVFPGEAAPSDTLEQRLQQASGTSWRHAWAAALTTP